MRCVIVVPTYHEAASLPELLIALETLRTTAEHAAIDVLVVEDNSPDGTGALVRAHSGFGDWLTLLTRTSKDGLGAAYRAGLTPYADDSHPVTTVPAMLALLRTDDVVLGSRYVPGGATKNWPVRRQILSWCANFYARRVLALSTRDTTSGFRAWRSEALVAAGVLHTASNGYGFQVENTWRSERLGLRVAEHPITFTERTAGASKMSPEVAWEAAALVLRWRLGRSHAGPAPR